MADSTATSRYWEAMKESPIYQGVKGVLDVGLFPWRMVRELAARRNDALLNAAAKALVAERPNPESQTMSAQADLDKSLEAVGGVVRGMNRAGVATRRGALDVLDWKDVSSLARAPNQTDPMPGPMSPVAPSGPMALAGPGALDMGQGMGGNTPVAMGLRKPNQQPQGALGGPTRAPLTIQGESTRVLDSAPQAAPTAAPPTPDEPAYKPGALTEDYMKRRGAIPTKVDRRLTEQDKGRALVDLGLKMMSASSRPGSSMLGALGEGGQSGMASVRQAERENREQDTADIARRTSALDSEFNVRSKDEDRRAQAAQLEETRRGRLSNEAIARDRTNLMRQQLQEGRQQVVETPKGYVLVNKVTGQSTPLVGPDGKPIISGKDPRPAEVQLLEYLKQNPDAASLWLGGKGRTGMSDKDVLAKAVELTKSQAMAGTDTGELLKKNIQAVRQNMGGALSSGLPLGLPPGSRYVGTKYGNPAYETPDGRRFFFAGKP